MEQPPMTPPNTPRKDEVREPDLIARLREYRPRDEWGDGVHHMICTEAADALQAQRDAFDGFARALESGDFANVAAALNERMCCNGQECGCRGSSVGDYLAHELRAYLKESGK